MCRRREGATGGNLTNIDEQMGPPSYSSESRWGDKSPTVWPYLALCLQGLGSHKVAAISIFRWLRVIYLRVRRGFL